MEVFKIVGFALVSVAIIVILKEQKKEIALIFAIAAGIGLLAFTMTKMTPILDMLNTLVTKSGINTDFFKIILKVTGIAYIVEFGKNICDDAGQSAIASKLEMAGKVVVLGLCVPLISALMEVLIKLI